MTTEFRGHTADGAVDALPFIQGLLGTPLTIGALMEAIRQGEGQTQAEFAARLGISKSHLCDIEKGRKLLSPERAVRFAAVLGYAAEQFLRLTLQEAVDHVGLHFTVELKQSA